MRAFRVLTGSHVRKAVVTAGAAAVMYLAGCAMERLPESVRAPSACRINAVLYCEVDAALGMSEQKCRCVRSRDLRDRLRGLSRP